MQPDQERTYTQETMEENNPARVETDSGMADMLKMLLEDRRMHEEMLRRREEEIIAQKERYERELIEERERDTEEQRRLMEAALQRMVVAAGKRDAVPGDSKRPKLTKLTEQDDVEATFERLMGVSGIEKTKWAFK